jgi:uncharacterized glyoxalase superfamily protein PhnB
MKMNKSMPKSSVIPVLAYEDVQTAVEWLCKAFGFSVRLKIGEHRAQLHVGEGAIVVNKLNNKNTSKEKQHSTMVRIENVDRHYERAKENGSKILLEPEDYPYGERQYTTEDIGGHVWTFSQSIKDSKPEEWGGISVNLE